MITSRKFFQQALLVLMFCGLIMLGMEFVMLNESASKLPKGFVYIHEVDPTIKVGLRYHGSDNFLGRPVEGYNSKDVAIMTAEAADALSCAQKILKKDGFGIIVYDAYRPQRAVNDFGKWAEDGADQKEKEAFYPYIEKDAIHQLGYIARRSSHSRGSAVDISIYELKKGLSEIVRSKRSLNNGLQIVYMDDGSVDMGVSFDLFDEASHYSNELITAEQKKNRNYLKQVMESCNFVPYEKEWWHFNLAHEPFPDTYYDFVVE